MEFKFEKIDGILLVGIFGELDHHNAASLREAVDREMLTGGASHMIIDLSGLELMDSSGIGVIMGRFKLVESLGGRLCVSGANHSIRKIIELSGLGKLVCDTAADAMKILKGGR